MNTNHSNLAFDREIDKCKVWLQTKVFDACGYSAEVLVDRLVQRVVEISHCSYATAVIGLLRKTNGNAFPTSGAQINCNRAFMEIGSGRITITPRQWLANQFDFVLHWTFGLLSILSVKRARKGNLSAVLIFGVGEESIFKNGNDEQFVSYCRLGPIAPLRSRKLFLVQSTAKHVSSCPSDFAYCRNPLVGLLREATLGCLGRFQLLVNHFILFLRFMFAVSRVPQLSLLGRDFAYCSISRELDKKGLIDSIISTCSSFTTQQLWMRDLRRATVHMIWYAQNWRPISYSADHVVSDVPNLRWIRVDTHWVWTHAFAEYLKALGHDKAIEVVGPILWYMPEINNSPKNAIKIAIFDISPFADEIALIYGEITNYFHPHNMFSFVRDVISLKSELEKTFHLPVSFRLKTKRGYNSAYDRSYFDHLEALGSLGSIELEHHSANMYSLISSSHLVIVYPFSSPAYLAEALNVPSIYYDPTKSIFRQHFGDSPSLIDFANCREGLCNSAISALNNVFSNEGQTH
jgi:hypothetical protein